MRIVHFSDPHAGGPAEDIMAYVDKRFVGVFNYRWRRRFKHDLSRLERAVAYILDTKPDVIVCTGDLTSTGQPGEFAKVRPILAPLVQSRIPFFYMPGNHDCYVTRPKCVAAVNEMVLYLTGKPFDAMPRAETVCGVEFMMVNCSRPSNLLCSWGFLSRQDSLWLEERCTAEKKHPRVLLSHYPLLEEHPILRMRHRLFGQKNAVGLLRSGALDLVLCGHVHRQVCNVDERGRGECIAGSVTRNGTLQDIDYDNQTDRFFFRSVDLNE